MNKFISIIFVLFISPYSFSALSVNGLPIPSTFKLELKRDGQVAEPVKIKKIQEEIDRLTITLKHSKKNNASQQQIQILQNAIDKKQTQLDKAKESRYSTEYHLNKSDKNLVLGFASFLKNCDPTKDQCKDSMPMPCKATFKNKTLYNFRLSSISDCLNERVKFIKSKKMSSISQQDFLKDQKELKVIKYTYGENSFKMREFNNCHAYIGGLKSVQVFDTHMNTKDQCLSQCQALYLKKYNKNKVLSCLYWWDSKKGMEIIGLIGADKQRVMNSSINQKHSKIIISTEDKFGNPTF